MSTSIEAMLGRALRGEQPQQVRKPVRKNFSAPQYHRYKTTYIYSVQESYGGPRIRVEYSLPTFNSTEVQQYAEQKMAECGYTNAVLLDVVKS